ncbi:hypothetical protein [Variovorax boronicumulans]
MSIVINSDSPEERRRRQTRISLITIVAGSVAVILGVAFGGIGGLYTGPGSVPPDKVMPSTLVLILGVAALITGGAFAMLLYLRPALADSVLSGVGVKIGMAGLSFYPSGSTEDTLKDLTKQVNELRARGFREKSTDVSAISESLLPSVQDSILERLQTRYSSEALDATRLIEVRNVYISLENRLRLEIDSLGLRGNINLTIGVFTTLLAVAALAFMVLTSDRKFDTIVDVLSHYLPRLSLVVFIEIFSFFFLRLYRSTLDEIRFYQERLNESASQKVAIELAWALNDSEARAAFARTLLTSRKGGEARAMASEDIDLNALAKVVAQLVKLVPSGSTAKQG